MGPGLLLAPRAQGSKIKRFSKMPKVINTWLAEGGDKWNEMMVSYIFLLVSLTNETDRPFHSLHQPISAQPVFVKRKIRVVKQNTPDQATNISDATASPSRMTNLFSRFRRSLILHNTLEPDTIDEKQASIPSTPNYRIRVEMLQLAVLISMPSPRKSQRKNPDLDDDEKESDDELPSMVFGVTRVNYRQPPSPTLLPLQPKQT